MGTGNEKYEENKSSASGCSTVLYKPRQLKAKKHDILIFLTW